MSFPDCVGVHVFSGAVAEPGSLGRTLRYVIAKQIDLDRCRSNDFALSGYMVFGPAILGPCLGRLAGSGPLVPRTFGSELLRRQQVRQYGSAGWDQCPMGFGRNLHH